MRLSDRFADILSKIVRYDFRERYQSAIEVLQELTSTPSIPYSPTIPSPAPVSANLPVLAPRKIISNQLQRAKNILVKLPSKDLLLDQGFPWLWLLGAGIRQDIEASEAFVRAVQAPNAISASAETQKSEITDKIGLHHRR